LSKFDIFTTDGMGEVEVMVWEEAAGKARELIGGGGNA